MPRPNPIMYPDTIKMKVINKMQNNMDPDELVTDERRYLNRRTINDEQIVDYDSSENENDSNLPLLKIMVCFTCN